MIITKYISVSKEDVRGKVGGNKSREQKQIKEKKNIYREREGGGREEEMKANDRQTDSLAGWISKDNHQTMEMRLEMERYKKCKTLNIFIERGHNICAFLIYFAHMKLIHACINKI